MLVTRRIRTRRQSNMNVQATNQGTVPQLSGQATNQGTVPQNNGNSQMQNLASAGTGVGPSRSVVGPIDHDVLKLRRYMQVLVLKVLKQRLPPPESDDAGSKAKYMDVARRLELGLFKMADSKEEYVNESTLESRLASLIKRSQLNNYNQQHANSSSVGRMVPTTGLSHTGGDPSSMVTSSACGSVGLGPSHNTVVPIDHAVLELRKYMRTLVLSELHKHQPCPADDASKAKYLEVARRLEESMFQMSNTREDYINPSTLTYRMASLIKGRKSNNYSQIQQNDNPSRPGTMTTLAPEVSAQTTIVLVREEVPPSEDELETEIA